MNFSWCLAAERRRRGAAGRSGMTRIRTDCTCTAAVHGVCPSPSSSPSPSGVSPTFEFRRMAGKLRRGPGGLAWPWLDGRMCVCMCVCVCVRVCVGLECVRAFAGLAGPFACVRRRARRTGTKLALYGLVLACACACLAAAPILGVRPMEFLRARCCFTGPVLVSTGAVVDSDASEGSVVSVGMPDSDARLLYGPEADVVYASGSCKAWCPFTLVSDARLPP